MPSAAGWAQDTGADVFKSEWALCTRGKIGPKLRSTKLSDEDIVALWSKGHDSRKIPHKTAFTGLTEPS